VGYFNNAIVLNPYSLVTWLGACRVAAHAVSMVICGNCYNSYQGLALSMGDGKFRPPQNPHPLTDHQEIWYRWLRRRPLRLCQIWWKYLDGGFWANGWHITKFVSYLFLFFINSSTGQTRLRIFTTDGSNYANSRKDVHFGCFADIVPHFGVEIPRKP